MITPIAMQPLAANDGLRLPRCVVFQTLGGAQQAAKRLAREASPVNLCEPVTDLGQTEVWAAIDDDARFIVRLDTIGGDWVVRPISLSEVTRLQQAHLRAKEADYREEAARCTTEAFRRPEGSAVRRELLRRADEMLDCARRVAIKLILGSVIDCDFASSERDSREVGSR